MAKPVSYTHLDVYKRQAKLDKDVKYGMEGNATIITGKSTYFEYFKDKILN